MRVRLTPKSDEEESETMIWRGDEFPLNQYFADKEKSDLIINNLIEESNEAKTESSTRVRVQSPIDWPLIVLTEIDGINRQSTNSISPGSSFSILSFGERGRRLASKIIGIICEDNGEEHDFGTCVWHHGLERNDTPGAMSDCPKSLRLTFNSSLVGGIPHKPHSTTFHPFAKPRLEVSVTQNHRLSNYDDGNSTIGDVSLKQHIIDSNGNISSPVSRDIQLLHLKIDEIFPANALRSDKFGRVIVEDEEVAYDGLVPVEEINSQDFVNRANQYSDEYRLRLNRHRQRLHITKNHHSVGELISLYLESIDSDSDFAEELSRKILKQIPKSSGLELIQALQNHSQIPNDFRLEIILVINRKLTQRQPEITKIGLITSLSQLTDVIIPENYHINALKSREDDTYRYSMWCEDIETIEKLSEDNSTYIREQDFERSKQILKQILDNEQQSDFNIEKITLQAKLGIEDDEIFTSLRESRDPEEIQKQVQILRPLIEPQAPLNPQIRKEIETGALLDSMFQHAICEKNGTSILKEIDEIFDIIGSPRTEREHLFKEKLKDAKQFRKLFDLGYNPEIREIVENNDLPTSHEFWFFSIDAIEQMYEFVNHEYLGINERILEFISSQGDWDSLIVHRLKEALGKYAESASWGAYKEISGSRWSYDRHPEIAKKEAKNFVRSFERAKDYQLKLPIPNCALKERNLGCCSLDKAILSNYDYKWFNQESRFPVPVFRLDCSIEDLEELSLRLTRTPNPYRTSLIRCNHGGKLPVIMNQEEE